MLEIVYLHTTTIHRSISSSVIAVIGPIFAVILSEADGNSWSFFDNWKDAVNHYARITTDEMDRWRKHKRWWQ
jgi:hypothetical protein